ncbi:dethiobiotin synthase [Desulfuromonas sp. TF]|jgi:dethiobiotin synthetase|uniref:dethiobiotin synthase n=1 Tax=Desulfuromonas sp. TF TaxID=1232410 RepID=UPI00040BFB70|nr:dethiobiotin synthase [Desulfuromonas sp. TF]
MSADLPKAAGVFVTGTDTGVGKTLVAAALARFLRERGLRVGVMKPVETGVADPSRPGQDAALLQWSSGSGEDPETIAPYRMRQPLAPSVAAEKEGVRIDPARIIDAARRLSANNDFIIVEGAGGLMVPLSGGLLMADLARDIGFPLLVVCRPGLGTLNHTLLTIFAARSMEIPLAGFFINGMPLEPDPAEESAPHTLASLASADLLGVLPRVQGDDRQKVVALAEEISALPTLPWLLANLEVPRQQGKQL